MVLVKKRRECYILSISFNLKIIYFMTKSTNKIYFKLFPLPSFNALFQIPTLNCMDTSTHRH